MGGKPREGGHEDSFVQLLERALGAFEGELAGGDARTAAVEWKPESVASAVVANRMPAMVAKKRLCAVVCWGVQGNVDSLSTLQKHSQV